MYISKISLCRVHADYRGVLSFKRGVLLEEFRLIGWLNPTGEAKFVGTAHYAKVVLDKECKIIHRPTNIALAYKHLLLPTCASWPGFCIDFRGCIPFMLLLSEVWSRQYLLG